MVVSLLRLLLVMVFLGACRDKNPTSVEHKETPDLAKVSHSEGEKLFVRYCALCHGNEGQGYVADNAPSLVTRTFLESASNDFLLQSIRRGRPGTPMAPYARDLGGPLDDDDIRTIITWLHEKGGTLTEHLPHTKPSSATVSAHDGEQVFREKCTSCHGDRTHRGEAIQLGNKGFLRLADDDFLRHAIQNGRPGTKMVAFSTVLTPAQIDNVMAMFDAWRNDIPIEAPHPVVVAPTIDAGTVVLNPMEDPPVFALKKNLYVSADQLKKAIDAHQRMVIVDARATSDWMRARIPGSISIPYYEMNNIANLPTDGTWIVAYCACPHHAAEVLVTELRNQHFTHTAVLDEGILYWQQHKLPIESSPGEVAPEVPMPLENSLPDAR